MSLEGDARSEQKASAEGPAPSAFRSRARRVARLSFAAFLLWHTGLEALRARSDGARPPPGFELKPWFVLLVLVLVCVPFGFFALRDLARAAFFSGIGRSSGQAESARALAFAEQLALLILAPFTIVHVAEMAWPLLTGSLAEGDVRPELVLLLSSTSHGLPLRAIAYLGAVGAASYYATRKVRAELGTLRPSAACGLVALGVLTYLLGSYAVIRCASGEIFP